MRAGFMTTDPPDRACTCNWGMYHDDGEADVYEYLKRDPRCPLHTFDNVKWRAPDGHDNPST
jgi:hypothetical protein